MKEIKAYIEENQLDSKEIMGNLIVEVWHNTKEHGLHTIWYHIESLEELKALCGDED